MTRQRVTAREGRRPDATVPAHDPGRRRLRRLAMAFGLAAAALSVAACAPDWVEVPGGGAKSPATVRAERRAYDGAPPVIPHREFDIVCGECHTRRGMQVEGVGHAPPSPHEETPGLSELSRCRQCHVFRRTDELFVATGFDGLRQDLRSGGRLHPLAPPTIPHKTFMRENCAACHTGPAAREPIRTTHPERTRCRQCHVPVRTTTAFDSPAGPVSPAGDQSADGGMR